MEEYERLMQSLVQAIKEDRVGLVLCKHAETEEEVVVVASIAKQGKIISDHSTGVVTPLAQLLLNSDHLIPPDDMEPIKEDENIH